jgi:hypothetical protein
MINSGPCVVVATLAGTEFATIALPRKLHGAFSPAVPMYSRAEDYRRRGFVANQRAAQTTDLSLKAALKDVARHWLALAERVDWLDRQHNGQQAEKNR